jgi:hypothetical protein
MQDGSASPHEGHEAKDNPQTRVRFKAKCLEPKWLEPKWLRKKKKPLLVNLSMAYVNLSMVPAMYRGQKG